jgi:hypothetical protein
LSIAKDGFKPYLHSVRYEGAGGGVAPKGLVDLSMTPFDELAAHDFRPRGSSFSRHGSGSRRAPRSAQSGTAGSRVTASCAPAAPAGPLFADDERIAEDLFCGLIARAPGAPVFLDAPLVNAAAVALAERHGMKPVFETARIYNKRPPDLPMPRIFGITSFKLG